MRSLPVALAFIALVTVALVAVGPAAVAGAAPPDAGFHLEPKAQIDDVFGDASDYRRVVDHFLQLTDAMQRTRDDFARAVQATLADLRPPPGSEKKTTARSRKCPEATVATTYARAATLGQEYLRTGRELTRYYDQVREYDRLGETIGLTPDYRWKVKKVLQQYSSLLVDYREMKVAFHDQLADELRYMGCNLDKLAARAGAPGAKDEAWPSPGELGAPGVPAVGEKGPLPLPPPPLTAKVTPADKADPIDISPTSRAGILFYIDNTRCQKGTRVALDGKPLGDVPAATRSAFSTTPGPHDLCLIAEATDANAAGAKKCGDPGTVRKSYLHEGWTIALRCD
ncbi:MAG: hypothetical protein EXR72_11180 [Myxococcales bacterium]|nr:hypothetical protein [Myxococcales bacterium]